MRFTIIEESVENYDPQSTLTYSSSTHGSLKENYVEIASNKILDLRSKSVNSNNKIHNPTDFKLTRIKQKDRTSATYLLNINSQGFLETNFFLLDIKYCQYIKIKFLKGEYPFEIIQYNATLLSIIFGSVSGALTSLIIYLIKSFC